MVKKFVEFCKNNLDLDESCNFDVYSSLSVCIIDCIYSLQARYYSVTVPIVKRYADKYMNGDSLATGDNLIDFINHIDEAGGCEKFAQDLLKNRQKLNGRLKSEVCYELAKKLRILKIETKEDFRNYKEIELLEIVISSVKGIGSAALNYLFMLAGDPNRCKPDVHVHHCIVDACGKDISDDDCQILLKEAVEIIKINYPNITVRNLDNIIWNKYQVGQSPS